MLIRVETKQTKFSLQEMTYAFIKAWIALFEEFPTKQNIGVIFAQWSLESGQGKYCWNFNIGNIKAVDVPGKEIKYIALNNVWEIINSKKVILDKENPGAWFRAFDSLEEGVIDHFKFLSGKRWKFAWSAVLAGDPVDFAVKLKQQRYYTAPVEDYIKGLSFYFNQFIKSDMFEKSIKQIQDEYKNSKPEKPLPHFPIIIDLDTANNSNDLDKPIQLTLWQRLKTLIANIFSKDSK